MLRKTVEQAVKRPAEVLAAENVSSPALGLIAIYLREKSN